MNLKLLRYNYRSERSRSITGAAKQLFISQPNFKPRHPGAGKRKSGFYGFHAQLPAGRHPHGERKGNSLSWQKRR